MSSLGAQMNTSPFSINLMDSIFRCLKSEIVWLLLPQSIFMNRASMFWACLSNCYLHMLFTFTTLELAAMRYFEFRSVRVDGMWGWSFHSRRASTLLLVRGLRIGGRGYLFLRFLWLDS